MVKHDAILTLTTIQKIDNLLLIDHNASKPSFTIRINWIYKFV